MTRLPPALKPGDLIAMVCPGGFMAAANTEACVRTLEQWGYHVRIGSTVGGTSTNYFSGSDMERLTDLQHALDDPQVAAVICARGGYGLSRIIDRLDLRRFRRRPKWIIGFSDVTLLLNHILRRTGIATVHGPMAAAFADPKAAPYVESLRQIISGTIPAYREETGPDSRTGKASGLLVGGNLALLSHSVGSRSAPPTEGNILLIEDVGEHLYQVDRMLWQLKRAGWFRRLSGVVAGSFTEIKDTLRPFGSTVTRILADITDEYGIPLATDFPSGHQTNNRALVLGARYQLSVEHGVIRLEPAPSASR